jgi:hypothetical protein
MEKCEAMINDFAYNEISSVDPLERQLKSFYIITSYRDKLKIDEKNPMVDLKVNTIKLRLQ